MTNVPGKQEAVDDAGRVPDTPKDIPEERPDRDESGWYVACPSSLLCFPAALLGVLIVAVAHSLVLGVVAGFVGLVVGQVVSVAIALWINSGTTTDPDWLPLHELPADQRVGSGLGTRRKERLTDVVREVASILVVLFCAPVATLLTALLIGWTAGD